MRSVHAALKPGGRVLLVDFYRDPSKMVSHEGKWALEHIRADKAVFVQEVCAAGFRVVAIAYPRAPEQPFPDPVVSVMRAVVWAHADSRASPPVAVMGESAGASSRRMSGSRRRRSSRRRRRSRAAAASAAAAVAVPLYLLCGPR